ncbi:MAG: MmgE/PrpD family protein, partial [Janthinobacterium lividum]
MLPVDRRSFLKAGAVASVASTTPVFAALTATGGANPGPASPTADKPGGAGAKPVPRVTRILAKYIVDARYEDLPADVRKEGVRTLLNWVGVAVGGSREDPVKRSIAALRPFSGPPQASLLGRVDRFDIMNAAFINGVSSHIFDYDDTHLKT